MAAGCYVPENETPTEVKKARKDNFEKGLGVKSNCWWTDPMLAGKPASALGIYRVSAETARAAMPLDFVGINVYQPFNFQPWLGRAAHQKPGAPKNSMGWTARFMYERYQRPIMVTGNGMADNDFICLDGKVHDGMRADFIRRYLGALGRAL